VSEHTGKKLISREDFNGIDSNNNGLIERDEILQLSLETLENIFDGEEPGAVNIRGKFSSSPPEQAVHSKDELWGNSQNVKDENATKGYLNTISMLKFEKQYLIEC